MPLPKLPMSGIMGTEMPGMMPGPMPAPPVKPKAKPKAKPKSKAKPKKKVKRPVGEHMMPDGSMMPGMKHPELRGRVTVAKPKPKVKGKK